ncbi:hypothetical protein E1258_25585 [Micromonospora sp. KC207]|nr:hypothetical protein E1258_25585 [Micromonospora sp. KC207]
MEDPVAPARQATLRVRHEQLAQHGGHQRVAGQLPEPEPVEFPVELAGGVAGPVDREAGEPALGESAALLLVEGEQLEPQRLPVRPHGNGQVGGRAGGDDEPVRARRRCPVGGEEGEDILPPAGIHDLVESVDQDQPGPVRHGRLVEEGRGPGSAGAGQPEVGPYAAGYRLAEAVRLEQVGRLHPDRNIGHVGALLTPDQIARHDLEETGLARAGPADEKGVPVAVEDHLGGPDQRGGRPARCRLLVQAGRLPDVDGGQGWHLCGRGHPVRVACRRPLRQREVGP